MEQRKPTKAQLERRLKDAIVHIDKDKDTMSVFFSDKGLRLTVTDDYVIVSTNYHRHVFDQVTSAGISRPYIYLSRFIDIVLTNDCSTVDGYSYSKLFDILKAKEDKTEYNIAWYCDLYFFNIFDPLYTIGESSAMAFLTFLTYIFNIAKNNVILSERKEDMTNLQFADRVLAQTKEFLSGMDEQVIFPKQTDEEIEQEEISALREIEDENALKQGRKT